MYVQDFIENFTTIEICDVSPDFCSEEDNSNGDVPEDVERGWKVIMYKGAWALNHTAGGCRNYIGKFHVMHLYFSSHDS